MTHVLSLYRRMSFWPKFGVWAGLASILSLVIAVVPFHAQSGAQQTTHGSQSPIISDNAGSITVHYNMVTPKPLEQAKPTDPRLPLLLGTWKGVLKQGAINSQSSATGYTRWHDSGSYSYSGEWSFIFTKNERISELIFLAQSTGTWRLDGNQLAVTLTNIKTQPKTLKEEGQPAIDLSNPAIVPLHRSLPKPEDVIPRGSSMDYEIVELTPSTLKLRGKDLKGVDVSFEGIRQ